VRLLVVGHSYVTAFAQRKYVAMKRMDPDLEVRIVTPATIPHAFRRYRHERHSALLPGETIAIGRLGGRSHMTYALEPFRLSAVLRRFEPDRIHIEEDPHSVIGYETVSLARRLQPKVGISFFIWDNLTRVPRFPKSLLKRVLTKYCLGRADLVVCGNIEAERLLRTVKGYEGRTAIIPQVGLDLEDYAWPPARQVREQVPASDGSVWVGFVGRLAPEKGLGLLLESLRRLPHLPWRLLVIGSGPLRHEIESRWRALFGDRLLFLAPVRHEAVADYLKCLDVFVLPSYATASWKEQFGLTLAQAMMAGAACIGSSCGAIPEVVGDAGVIVPERDQEGLSRALSTMLCSESARRALQGRARQAASARFSNIGIAGRYLEVFRAASPVWAAG
jgi:glycosyltransferase involved in cell wall biosynthesis